MKNLKVNDYIGISFWLISIALAATTGFLVIERNNVNEKWKLPISVSALVTHYLSCQLIREFYLLRCLVVPHFLFFDLHQVKKVLSSAMKFFPSCLNN